MSRCLRRRGRAAAGGALVVLAAAALVVGWPLAPRATATAPFVVLQLNLCNGGFSPCFSGGKRSVDSAIALINDRQPDVVTLNEICARDITRMAQETGYRWQFMPVGTKGSGAPYQCSDGRGDYGIAVISNPKRGAARDAVVKQQYAHQDGGNQQLGYLCAPLLGVRGVHHHPFHGQGRDRRAAAVPGTRRRDTQAQPGDRPRRRLQPARAGQP